ncbi:hypothetical protein A2U01_0060345 [Trifolium medium]|uniref:Uncharacterized protein n=1 Tax=Trifolium medium TaxID=97028 RepID=A0A392RU36_9FABA|nr:hypothetical protein [Trifolium medium]
MSVSRAEQDYLLMAPSRLSASCAEQDCQLAVSSRGGFGPAHGPVQNSLIKLLSYKCLRISYFYNKEV